MHYNKHKIFTFSSMNVTSLLNCRFTPAIRFHDMLHGFWVGDGIGTVSL